MLNAVSFPLFTFLLFTSTASLVQSSVDAPGLERYEDMLMQGLYKRLAGMDSSLLYDIPDGQERDIRDYYSQLVDASEDGDRELQATEIRDSEKIEHSSNAGSQGPIHMSGGSGEGKQHLKPDGSLNNIKNGKPSIKSDEKLPYYCNPPNPCPNGFTEKDNCQMDIADTAEVQKEWIRRLQMKGACTCDREHMYNCDESEGVLDTSGIDGVFAGVIPDQVQMPHFTGEKRVSLVAKKSPRVKRAVSNEDSMELELTKMSDSVQQKNNPFLAGERLRTVAKKGGVHT